VRFSQSIAAAIVVTGIVTAPLSDHFSPVGAASPRADGAALVSPAAEAPPSKRETAPPQDPTAVGLTQEKNYTHHWIDVDGVKTHYIQSGKGEPLVLVHGALPWCSSQATYGDVVGRLGKNFNTIALDVIGFGYTKARGPQDYSGQAQAEFVIKFIEALGVGPVYIEGNSHGGFLTQYVAHERPNLVRKLVISNSLNGTAPIPNENYAYASERRYYRSQTAEQIREMLEGYYKHKDLVTDDRVKLVHDLWQRNYEYAHKRALAVGASVEAFNKNLNYKGKHISEWGGQLKIPVLLVFSEPGSKVEWGIGHFFRVPGAEMHILPWSGHHLFTDQPDRWVQVVTEWLKNKPARPPT